MLELYQAEWCPYSHKVRERLTELGVDFVARQVAPRREEREAMREATGDDTIPLLVTEGGDRIQGGDEILGYLDDQYAADEAWERGHRAQARAHPDLRQGASHGPLGH